MTALEGEALPRWSGFGCRLHGETCRIPWGYDEAHTDSPGPYTLDELAARRVGPHRFAYGSAEEYERAWYLWRALKWDAELTTVERDARFAV
jgi:hypothetical protein